ncbi:hypothetical protein AB0N16_10480 [Streptomyces sp. NPDC051105]|uniref:hypothetical protein n=1 Tax=Streptomyces sp. NPDC051105 TaxID=3154843 RepID=UPI0034231F65
MARVSLGSGVAQAAYTAARRAALEPQGTGGYISLQHALGYPVLNGLFAEAR